VQWHVQPNIKNFNLKDAFANNILLNNFPEIPIPSAKEFDRTGGLDDGVDIICGSPPCIGFSQGNPTSGADHPANKNFINMFEFIAYYRPKYYLVEIVPRILKPGVGREIMLKAMDKVEMYKTRKVCEFKIENYGCPARRDRCYFFGSLEDISFDPLWEFESIFSAGKPTGKSVNILGKPEYEKFKGVMELEGEIVSRYDCSGKLRTGPFRSALKASRILMPDEPAYTITGMAYCNMKHWDRDSASGLNRFLAVSEIADLMGMPADYEYLVDNLHRKNKVDIKCNIIASGVDTRFTTKLLKFIAGRIRGGT
jgi:site-specific DNA-cytosine methylase